MTKQNFGVLVALLASASLTFGQNRKVSPAFAGKNPNALVNVIIQYKQTPQQRHFDAVAQRGGSHLGTFNFVRSASYAVPANALADLANDPDVAYISPDHPLHAATTQAWWGNSLQSDFKLQAINADIAQSNGYNGNDVGIAIIDSGITTRPDFRESFYNYSVRVVYSQNMINGGIHGRRLRSRHARRGNCGWKRHDVVWHVRGRCAWGEHH